MTDDEIVTLAVKAYGDAPLGFSPLTDDGDALRLAVKLVMEMDHNHAADNCLWVSVRVPRQVFCAFEEFADESERLSATRRAIVRAAAEIGRTMP